MMLVLAGYIHITLFLKYRIIQDLSLRMNSDDYARVQSVLSLPYGACPAASWIRKTIPT